MSSELGLIHRVVANGIYVNTSEEEIETLRESKIENAILLAFDPANPYQSIHPEDRLEIIRSKLLEIASKAGVKGILIDAVVLDPASIGLSASTIYLVKNELGYPSGCAPANALALCPSQDLGLKK